MILSSIARRLELEQFGVAPAVRRQFLVGAGLEDPPFSSTMMRSAIRTVEKRCEISMRGPAAAEVAEALEHLVFGAGVERGGRLVEDEHLGVAHVGAGDGDLLPLAAGEVAPSLKRLPSGWS